MISLQSGSNGNCIYVEADGVRLLVDAGISGRQAEVRLNQHGLDIRQIDAVLISHDHVDHTRSLGIFQRKYALPAYVTEKTLAAARRHRLGNLGDVRHFDAGTRLCFGRVTVETVATPHDGADGVAFVVDDGRSRLGILTDLGHAFAGLDDLVASLDAVLIESNFDPDLLANGPRPEYVKQRVRGPGGHLSNHDAAEVLHRANGRLRWACLGHLSEDNNRPDLVLSTHQAILGDRFPLHLASRYAAGQALDV